MTPRSRAIQLGRALRRRAERQWLLGRAIRRRHHLTVVSDRTAAIRPRDILGFVTLRNERPRLRYFLNYYRSLGVAHFLMVDNDSTDGSADFLGAQPDVSLWHTKASYKAARFGMDWINGLLYRYGRDHWCLTVDPDEFLVYPHCDARPLRALTDWLDDCGTQSFGAMLLDTYPRGPVDEAECGDGDCPFEVANWFDPANYMIQKNRIYQNLWVQGGPRARRFFYDSPMQAPALNKIPLVRWHWRNVYVSSTHMALPADLNLVYDAEGGEMASGCLLHTKFLSDLAGKAGEEMDRRQHYADSQEYRAYQRTMQDAVVLWNEQSRRYQGWRQLERLGLMSRGHWA